ncbi:MAG: hypothetical protein ACREV6_17995 [Clostridium sp.]|uniref:hypothetical protein n=1 Tax=Clostridium sp. TaxID=1506 RepID=UPI003D6C72A3
MSIRLEFICYFFQVTVKAPKIGIFFRSFHSYLSGSRSYPLAYIKIGSKLYTGEKIYGTVVKESEIFYYIQKGNDAEEYEFMKDSLKDKVANKKLLLVDW